MADRRLAAGDLADRPRRRATIRPAPSLRARVAVVAAVVSILAGARRPSWARARCSRRRRSIRCSAIVRWWSASGRSGTTHTTSGTMRTAAGCIRPRPRPRCRTRCRGWSSAQPLRAGPLAPGFGAAHGKNLIVVQVESLQEFAVDFQVAGQAVMPHLRDWAQRQPAVHQRHRRDQRRPDLRRGVHDHDVAAADGPRRRRVQVSRQSLRGAAAGAGRARLRHAVGRRRSSPVSGTGR